MLNDKLSLGQLDSVLQKVNEDVIRTNNKIERCKNH